MTSREETFSAISEGFKDFICQMEGARGSRKLALAAKLVCEAVNHGHVCLDLNDASDELFLEKMGLSVANFQDWSTTEWIEELMSTKVVGSPGSLRPLILDHANRLYLYRYWMYEQTLAQDIIERSKDFKAFDMNQLSDKLDSYFAPDVEQTDHQRVAAAIAATRSLSVISGGPGTGKTTTVVKILALLLELAENRSLSIALAAPTGKAAARLKAAITLAKQNLPCGPELAAKIPEDVRTLHRLLGSVRNSPYFRHNAQNPLPYDVVVVDEASMVDLPMMAKLVHALPRNSRLILLGDKNQLSSVEAGAVLGEICQTGAEVSYSAKMKEALGKIPGLERCSFGSNPRSGPWDSLVTLNRNFRFGETSGIGRLSAAVNAGHAKESLSILCESKAPDVKWEESPSGNLLHTALKDRIIEGFTDYLKSETVAEALFKYSHFMILCALKKGPWGVSAINAFVEQALAECNLINPVSRWYKGRPVMITANDYNLGLFNGDIGILWDADDTGQSLRAFFPDATGGLRSMAPSRLPSHETAYSCTVHKSQGSEFQQVLVLMPNHDTKVLTRELIYTAVTRAKLSVEIWGRKEIFALALERRVKRTSGLGEAIWGKNATFA